LTDSNKFHVIVCAILKNDKNEIFIARRAADKKLGGFWEFPGGKLEMGEELEPALKREIKEELSIEIEIEKLLHVNPHKYPHGSVLILFYLCKPQSTNFKLVDHDEIAWCTLSELQNYKLLPANEEVLEKLKDYHSRKQTVS
jgi:mutator protein MutT